MEASRPQLKLLGAFQELPRGMKISRSRRAKEKDYWLISPSI